MKKLLQQALTVLKEWDALIKYQFTGSSEAMSALQYAAWNTIDIIKTLEAELANLIPNIEDASQDWAKLDGAVAWHLIERHAENWGDIGKMMDEYVAAKLAKPEQKQECETCAAKRKRLLDAGFLKSPLREEPAKPEQEPVATVTKIMHNGTYYEGYFDSHIRLKVGTKLYTSPPRKEWVGLTDEEAAICWTTSAVQSWKNIEAKLKEKNGF